VASWLPTALLSITIGAVGQLLLKLAARTAGALRLGGPGFLHSLERLIVNPYLILGVLCFVSSMILWVKVLTVAELSTSYPMVSLGYVIVAVLSAVVLREHLGVRQIVAIAVIIAGVILLGQR
jgi:drug/metabolite transporter (DMT)-like permease